MAVLMEGDLVVHAVGVASQPDSVDVVIRQRIGPNMWQRHTTVVTVTDPAVINRLAFLCDKPEWDSVYYA